MQRCGAGPGGEVDIGALLDQKLDHVATAHGSRYIKRRGAGFVIAGIERGTVSSTGAPGPRARSCGVVQRSPTIRIAAADISPAGEEHLSDCEMALQRGIVEGAEPDAPLPLGSTPPRNSASTISVSPFKTASSKGSPHGLEARLRRGPAAVSQQRRDGCARQLPAVVAGMIARKQVGPFSRSSSTTRDGRTCRLRGAA